MKLLNGTELNLICGACYNATVEVCCPSESSKICNTISAKEPFGGRYWCNNPNAREGVCKTTTACVPDIWDTNNLCFLGATSSAETSYIAKSAVLLLSMFAII